MRLPVGFAGADAPRSLAASVETHHGPSGSRRRSRTSTGSASVGAAARANRHRAGGRSPLAAPAALRRARTCEADQRALRRRGGGDRRRREVRIESPPGPAEDPGRPRHRRERRDPGHLVQPALARGAALPGHAHSASWSCEQVRLRRLELRLRRRGRDGRLRSRVSGDRGPVAEEAPRSPSQALELVRDVGEPLPAELRSRERLPLRADAIVALHRPRSLGEAEIGRLGLRSRNWSCFGSRSRERWPRVKSPRRSRCPNRRS